MKTSNEKCLARKSRMNVVPDSKIFMIPILKDYSESTMVITKCTNGYIITTFSPLDETDEIQTDVWVIEVKDESSSYATYESMMNLTYAIWEHFDFYQNDHDDYFLELSIRDKRQERGDYGTSR